MSKSNAKSFAGDIFYYPFAVSAAIAAVVFALVIGLLFSQSILNLGGENATILSGGMAMVKNVSQWFDDIFFQYNLLLLSIAVAIPPLITFFYVVGMKAEKKRRLKLEIETSLRDDSRNDERYEDYDRDYEIEQRVAKIFRFRHYLGSMSMLTMIVLLGCMIILLLKPLPLDGSGFGVDYRKGANFLMLGPYMELYVNGDIRYLTKLMGTLTAFQFGFLGAYVYFITDLVRSYFTLDLTPNTFVASSVRMMMGAMLALVCAFLFLDDFQSAIPIIGFCIGFFPQRGLLLIEKASSAFFNRVLGSKLVDRDQYFATELSQLPGMSYAHELRLQREGYDNAENLTRADPVELAIRTGFGYRQLYDWVSQAKLVQYLRTDYKAFIQATGICSVAELQKFVRNWRQQHPGQEPAEELAAAVGQQGAHKLRIICALECVEKNV